jgi:response regulator RpfG family c-di-GMP phosphodiesterase
MVSMTIEQAIEELKSNAGTQFDPSLVEIFIQSNIIDQARRVQSGNPSLDKGK